MKVYVVVTQYNNVIGVMTVKETYEECLHEIFKYANKDFLEDIYTSADIDKEVENNGYFLTNEVKYYIRKSELD